MKGSNGLGVWNPNETTLEIRVVPPLWRSPQAFILYFLLLVVVEFVAIRLIVKFNRLNQAVQMEQQLTDSKLRFFTNISHEFRTPLTIIRGTIESLSAQTGLSSEARRQLGFLEKSSLRLLRLINQLLEFRRLQNDQLALMPESTELVAFFRDIASAFDELASKKHIDFQFQTNVEQYQAAIDRGILDKVAYNLLSNAFKFTPEKGCIRFQLDIDAWEQKVEFRVVDNGLGIPPEKQQLLFVRFKQIHPSASGTGIGLHLASELIKEHQGDISYSDTPGGGATFTVSFPLNQSLPESELLQPATDTQMEEFDFAHSANDAYLDSVDWLKYKGFKLLVVEDDPEVSEFLVSQISPYFQVETAGNGLLGLQKCAENQPDLVVCDVMMPEMNGFELTKRLKAELETCHIPVVLLTAYASLDHKLKGIDAGADAYITKPFSVRYLLLRVVKLIEQRQQLQQKFVQEPGLEQLPNAVNKDAEFMQKLHELIEQNLANPDFSVDVFASSMQLGRTVFFKKVKTLTGYSPIEYLRVIRMKRAAEMLSRTQLNVSEVAYRVGFNNPFYFSKCFKEQFGINPSEYAKG